METIQDLELSQELQELHLENKEYMSKLLFLEDEYRFFYQLFQNRHSIIAHGGNEEEVSFVGNSLAALKKQMETLKMMISKHKHLLENILKDEKMKIGLEFIEQNNLISTQVAELLADDKKIKKELFDLVAKK